MPVGKPLDPLCRAGVPINASELPETPATIKTRTLIALIENPDYCSIAEAATILRRSKSSVREYYRDIEHIMVYGIRLYKREAVHAKRKHLGKVDGSRVIVKGDELVRLRRICEVYYRQNYDIAEPAMKRLAKRIARL